MNMSKIGWPGWETVRLIGRGSFGAVYEIQRQVFEDTEKAALKVIPIPQGEGDVDEMYNDGYDDASISKTLHDHLKSIVAEYSLMRKMSGCPNVVSCDDLRYEQHEDGLGWDVFIRMELLTPLVKALPAEIPEDMVIRVAKDLCAALIECKTLDIVHRDIKPQNIFLSPRGEYKLGDFGIAKTVEKTMGGTKIGTYKYMAPEVYNNQPYNSTADIYSLGLVLYWMLNERRMPFMPLPPAVMRASDEEHARSRRLSGEVLPAPKNGSEQLKQIVLKACAYDPKERFRTAGEMLAALNTIDAKAEPDPEPAPLKSELEPEAPMTEPKPASPKSEIKLDLKPAPPKPEPKSVNPKRETESKPTSPKKNKGWIIGACTLIAFVVIGFAFYSMCHFWSDATCTEPATCSICGKTQGESLGHRWADGKCAYCGEVSAEGIFNHFDPVAGHNKYSSLECEFVAISAGGSHTVALKSDGTVAAVGLNDDGQCNVTEWSDIFKIAAGSHYTLGLKSDGTVLVAGSIALNMRKELSAWNDIVAIAANDICVVGMRSDGSVVATAENEFKAREASGWKDIATVSAGSNFIVGLKHDGTVVQVGRDWYDVSSWNNIVAIDAGITHIAGLRSDGTVAATGNTDAFDVSGWRDIVSVEVGNNCIVGLKSDGTMISAGNTANGISNVSEWNDIVMISAGDGFVVGLKSDGTLVAVGDNHFGECDISGLKD